MTIWNKVTNVRFRGWFASNYMDKIDYTEVQIERDGDFNSVRIMNNDEVIGVFAGNVTMPDQYFEMARHLFNIQFDLAKRRYFKHINKNGKVSIIDGIDDDSGTKKAIKQIEDALGAELQEITKAEFELLESVLQSND